MGRDVTVALVLIGAVLATAGCGARREYYISHLAVEQAGWDTLRVDVDFARRTAIGGAREFTPDTATVQVFDRAYRSLYSGAPGAIPIPDERLGDREPLLVEICGIVEGRSICVQEQERASPKRIHVDQHIEYPEGGDYDRGRYDLAFRAERRRFDADGWEPLHRIPDVSGYLLARVDSQEDGRVKVPFTTSRGRFDLARHENYRDFKYYLDSRLLDEQQARVHFDVYAGINGQVARLASVEKRVELKTEEERREEVRVYAEQATERVVDELSSFLGGRRAVAYVDTWDFDPASRRYRVQMEVQWRGSFFRGDRYELHGELEVDEDGSQARFRVRSGNRDALRRWRDRVDADVLDLGTLDPPEQESVVAYPFERREHRFRDVPRRYDDRP